MSHYRSVEFRVWYKSPHGGSLLEIAKSDDALRDIRSRLDRLSVRYRIQRYYRLN